MNASDETTCGLHLRKDLTISRAIEVWKIHKKHYTSEYVARLHDRKYYAADISSNEKDKKQLRKDIIADIVVDYGELGSTIESLAQLKVIPGAKAELAMLSLGRGYIANCKYPTKIILTKVT